MNKYLVVFLTWLIDVIERNYKWTCPWPDCKLVFRSNSLSTLEEAEMHHLDHWHGGVKPNAA